MKVGALFGLSDRRVLFTSFGKCERGTTSALQSVFVSI